MGNVSVASEIQDEDDLEQQANVLGVKDKFNHDAISNKSP
jgi:hypothetical protein